MAQERIDRARKMVCRKGVTYTSDLMCLRPVNSRDHLSIYALHGEPLFFQGLDGPYLPTVRLLHKCEYPLPACRARLIITYNN